MAGCGAGAAVEDGFSGRCPISGLASGHAFARRRHPKRTAGQRFSTSFSARPTAIPLCSRPWRERMKELSIGDVTIISIIECDGPWRTPQEMFPAYDPINGKRHLAELDPEVFDPASGKMVITYQTYIVRTPRHTVLIDTCTGEDKGYPPPMDFPKQPWLD